MKKILIMSFFLGSGSAFASHPHDRVCVGETKLQNADSTAFVFQYEFGRNYEKGDPNLDSHTISLQASHSLGNYLDMEAVLYKSIDIRITQNNSLDKIPVELKDTQGNVYFNGVFNMPNETLTGDFTLDEYLSSHKGAKTAPATVKLNCVSQPLLSLDH